MLPPFCPACSWFPVLPLFWLFRSPSSTGVSVLCPLGSFLRCLASSPFFVFQLGGSPLFSMPFRFSPWVALRLVCSVGRSSLLVSVAPGGAFPPPCCCFWPLPSSVGVGSWLLFLLFFIVSCPFLHLSLLGFSGRLPWVFGLFFLPVLWVSFSPFSSSGVSAACLVCPMQFVVGSSLRCSLLCLCLAFSSFLFLGSCCLGHRLLLPASGCCECCRSVMGCCACFSLFCFLCLVRFPPFFQLGFECLGGVTHYPVAFASASEGHLDRYWYQLVRLGMVSA